MKPVLFISNMVMPLIMVLLHHRWPRIRFYFHLVAIISALIFGNISAFAIYDILKDETVFMTNIHAIFLNPIFLLTGAYLGIYLLYTLSLKLHKKRTTY